MKEKLNVRIKGLYFMYYYTIILPGLTGLLVVFKPDFFTTIFQWDSQYHYLIGITGSMWLSFSILSIFALKRPIKFLPVLAFQLSYKVIWLSCVVMPIFIKDGFSVYEMVFALTMLSYVIGDLIVIPFKYLMKRENVTEYYY